MAFNSLQFAFLFLPISFAGFWLLARRPRFISSLDWLILTSIFFYACAGFRGLAIIGLDVLFNYVTASALMRLDSTSGRLRKAIFVGGVIGNVLILGYIKYRNFFLDTANTLWSTDFKIEQAIFPLGISFLTFQQIAFIADIWSKQIPSINLRDYLFFSLFFPRTVAGPIVRYNEIVPQISAVSPREFFPNIAVGVCLFSIGLFKKTVLADGVAQYVPDAFSPATEFWLVQPVSFFTAWISVLAYTLELYFDFSGYSDMALGAARLFGLRLPMNFNSPLKAGSIVEFWGRWHITLTRFLTAYVYTPLVLHITRARLAKGKEVLRGKKSILPAIGSLVAIPTLLTMAISGLWHGAGWQFVLWGVLHGSYLTINQSWRLLRPRFWPNQTSYRRIMKPLGPLLTFMAVTFAMVFFRADSPAVAFSVLGGMVGVNGVMPHIYQNLGITMSAYLTGLIVPFCWISVLLLIVVLMPNSLEIMQRFQPALDFPSEAYELHDSHVVKPAPVRAHDSLTWTAACAYLHGLWAACHRIRRHGVDLSGKMATFIAATSVLAILALSGSTAFLYFRF